MAISQKTLLGGAGLAGAGMISALGFAAVRWDRATSQLVERLQKAHLESQPDAAKPSQANGLAAGQSSSPRCFDRAVLRSMPGPVIRYFERVLTDGQALVATACIEQCGQFRSGGALSKWQPFAATAHYTASRPGFVWDAAIQMAIVNRVCMRDSYIAGAGTMQAKVLALMSVVDAHGRTELDAGALQRYLAEAVWFPTALLPGPHLRWEGIDAHRAMAFLDDGATTVSLEFTFNDAGDVTRVYTPGRYREVDGNFVPTPWEARLSHHEACDGMRVPMRAEVGWRIEGENMLYFKARVGKLTHQFLE